MLLAGRAHGQALLCAHMALEDSGPPCAWASSGLGNASPSTQAVWDPLLRPSPCLQPASHDSALLKSIIHPRLQPSGRQKAISSWDELSVTDSSYTAAACLRGPAAGTGGDGGDTGTWWGQHRDLVGQRHQGGLANVMAHVGCSADIRLGTRS